MTEKEEFKSYSAAGVDVERGELCSRIAYEASQKTFSGRVLEQVAPEKLEGGFAGPLRLKTKLEGDSLVKNSDGVGSKALVAQRLGKYDTLGYDLIAMLADDTAATGALPVAGTNTLDVSKADPELVTELMKGLVGACKVASVAMVGGEIAELPDQVKGYANPFVWNGDLLGFLGKGRMIDGECIKPGQAVMGIRGNGIRSNGLTLAREICSSAFGSDWHEQTFDRDSSWGEVLLRPSRIFAPIIVALTGGLRDKPGADIRGVVHVTGGGLANLKRVLPEGTGAVLNDLFSPQEEFVRLQELGPVNEEEAYRTWNMGQPILIVTTEPEEAGGLLDKFDVNYRVVGRITDREGIVCQGKGFENKEFVL